MEEKMKRFFLIITVFIVFCCSNSENKENINKNNKKNRTNKLRLLMKKKEKKDPKYLLTLQEFLKYEKNPEKQVSLFKKMNKKNRIIFLKKILPKLTLYESPRIILKFLLNGRVLIDPDGNSNKGKLISGKWYFSNNKIVIEGEDFENELGFNKLVSNDMILKVKYIYGFGSKKKKINSKHLKFNFIIEESEPETVKEKFKELSYYYMQQNYSNPQIKKYCKKNKC